jgi:hypothetical protein
MYICIYAKKNNHWENTKSPAANQGNQILTIETDMKPGRDRATV